MTAEMGRPRIHNITVEGGWDGVPDHAINFEISVDVTGVPGTQLTLLSCDDPLVESIDVLSINSLESELAAFTMSPEAGPPPLDNSPTQLKNRPSLHTAGSMIVEHGSVPDSGNVTPSKSPEKSLYFPGAGMGQSLIRRRLFPPSPLANSPELTEAILGDGTDSVSSPSKNPLRLTSTSSTYLDVPAMEMDSHGLLHVPHGPREPSAETVNIFLPSRASSTGSVMFNRPELSPLARVFSPDVEAQDIIVRKSGARAFGDCLENRSLRSKASPLIDIEADDVSQASVSEPHGPKSPSKLHVQLVPARTSSRIPLKSPKKVDSPTKDCFKPSWRYPAAEEIKAQDHRPVSPMKIATPTSPTTPERKKNNQKSPVQPTAKKSLPSTPQKQITGTRSLENIGNSPQRGSTLKRETMTTGRMGGSRILERDRDTTIKGNKFGSLPDSARDSIPRWLADRKDCVDLGPTSSLTRESESSLQSLPQKSQLDQSFGLESGDIASYWDPVFDEPHKRFNIETSDETSLLPSPTPSSQRSVPWTSTKHIGYRPSADTLGEFSHNCFNWMLPIFPIHEYTNGNLLIDFPSDYNTGTCRIVLCANIFAGKIGPGGWQTITIPKLPTQEAQWGSLSLRIALDDDPPPVEFKGQGLLDPKTESECILGFFDPTSPLGLEVRFKETSHYLEKFGLDSDIQSRYEWDEENGLWVYYTASCALRDFDENFAANECKFALFVCNGPPGVMIRSLGGDNRSVSFDREGLIEAGNPTGGMKIHLVCPPEEIGTPFTLTWTAYLGTPPISVAMPKICASAFDDPDCDEDEELIWNKAFLAQFTGSVGSPRGLFRMTRTSPPRLRTNPIRPSINSWDTGIVTLADKVPSIIDEADDELSRDTRAYDSAVSSPRKPGGKRATKTRRENLHGKNASTQTVAIHNPVKAEAIPKVTEKPDSVMLDARKGFKVSSYQQGIGEAVTDVMNDVIDGPRYALVDIVGGLGHVVMKILVAGFVCFVDFFLPRQSATATRGVAFILRLIFRFVFIVCMLPLVNNVKDRAAVTVKDEWNGRTHYLGHGTVVARDVVNWAIDKTAPLVKGAIYGETDVEMLDEEVIPTVMVPETQTQEVPISTYTPTLRDRLDWALGWRGPYEE